MAKIVLLRSWKSTLVQGLIMIVLSIIIFNNPETVLATLAFWLGLSIALGGILGMVSYYGTEAENRSIYNIIGSVVMLLVGLIMILKITATVKAITMVFGMLTALLGLVILSSSFKNKAIWSLWWLVALLGFITLATGVKGFLDSYSGSKTISTIIGLASLFSGLGLIALSLLKRKLVHVIKDRVSNT